jgi:metal-sulfur cluster biosynthetic enzyme
MATVEDVEAALANVIDPELGLDFVELGLIYGIEIEGGHVQVTYSLTTPGCPIASSPWAPRSRSSRPGRRRR